MALWGLSGRGWGSLPVGDGQVEGHCLVRIAGLQVAHGGVDGARHAVGEQAGQRLAQLTQARQR